MRKTLLATAFLLSAVSMSACVGAREAGDSASRYTINRVTAAEVAIGNDRATSSVNRNTRPGEVQRIVNANPGLDAALARNGVDLSDVVNIRIRPSGVVDVFLR